MMKYFVLLFLIPSFLFGQSKPLDSANGFKSIKLGSPVALYKDIFDTGILSDGKALYLVVDQSFLHVGDIELKGLTVTAYQDTVRQIFATADIINGNKLGSALLKKYGYPSESNTTTEKYVWETDKVLLLLYRTQEGFSFFIHDNAFLKAVKTASDKRNAEDL